MANIRIKTDFRAKTSPEDFLEGAIATGNWLRSIEQSANVGSWWEKHPNREKEGQIDLMHGNAGIILFFLNLADATKDASWLKDAKRGAAYCVDRINSHGLDFLASGMSGLHYKEGTKYTLVSGGAAGVAFSLLELNEVAPNSSYTDTAATIAEEIVKNVIEIPEGITWSRKSGFNFDSGTILFLLYASKKLNHPEWIEVAKKAGTSILQTGTKEASGGTRFVGFTNMVKAMTGNDDPKADVPNFCYGTAGIGYTFARLYEATGEAVYLQGAKEAAAYLEGVAIVDGDAAVTPYRLPDLPNIHYLSSCHGIVGTIRLFHLLYQLTKDEHYESWVRKYINGFQATGAPELHSNGYWNCYSYCCGNAGYLDAFAGLYIETKEKDYLDLVNRNAAVILAESHQEVEGLSWYQAFKRIDPSDVTKEIGYYSGAAGIGAALAQAYLANENKAPTFRLLEEPYPIRN